MNCPQMSLTDVVYERLSTDVVYERLFISCALNLPVDDSKDDAIHCFKEGQPCSTGQAVLKSQLDILDEPAETNPFDTEEYTSSDVEEAYPIIQLLDSDNEGDSDIVPKIELSEDQLQSNIVEELLEQEEDGHLGVIRDSETGNPTMDQYIDEWLSPKKPKRDANDVCLMNGDAMLSAVMNDDEQEVLERETECDGRDVDKYIKQLKSRAGRSFTKFENTICSLDEDDDIGIEKISVVT